eukprot:TRINITY_DN45_c2_g1_i9.p1 TRINITY_DN45_c2_g1~~TRINITY_DN45_c2_g1_i9.p1  ORF type:complete len:1098 (+),score=304.13 TRINITY_DN45_c2_g1_i9:80-3295(+)
MPPARRPRSDFQPGQQVRARNTVRDAWQTGRVTGTDPGTEHYLVRVDGQSGGKALPFAIVEPPVPACPRKELLAALEAANLTIPGPGQPQEPRLLGDHIVYSVTITGTRARTEVTARYRDMRAVAQSVKHLMPTGAAIPGKKWFGNKADEKLLRQRAHGFQVYFDRALRTAEVQASAQFAALEAFLRLDLFARQDAIRTKCQACCREAAQGIRRRYLRKFKAWSEQRRAFHGRLLAAERLLVKNERGVLLVCFRRLLRRREERIAHRRHIAEQEEEERLRRAQEEALRLEAERQQRLREDEADRREREALLAERIAALSAEEAGGRDSIAEERLVAWYREIELPWATRGRHGSLGIHVSSSETDDDVHMVVKQVFPGKAAEKAGLRPGDKITHVSYPPVVCAKDLPDARAVADSLYGCIPSGRGSPAISGDMVMKVLSKVNSQHQWALVQKAFKAHHPRCHGGDLRDALATTLPGEQLDRVVAMLRRRRVLFHVGPDEEHARVEVLSRQDFSEALSPASGICAGNSVEIWYLRPVPGQGVREDRCLVYPEYDLEHLQLKQERNMEHLAQEHPSCMWRGLAVKRCAEMLSDPLKLLEALKEVCQAQKAAAAGSSVGEGDAAAPLRLSLEELQCAVATLCTDVLKCRDDHGRGPITSEQVAAAFAAEASALCPQAEEDARRLHKAMKGFGTDEKAVWAALGRVRSTADWQALQHKFRELFPKHSKGDLRAALKDDLSAAELDRARRIVASGGADWDAPAAAPERYVSVPDVFAEVKELVYNAVHAAEREVPERPRTPSRRPSRKGFPPSLDAWGSGASASSRGRSPSPAPRQFAMSPPVALSTPSPAGPAAQATPPSAEIQPRQGAAAAAALPPPVPEQSARPRLRTGGIETPPHHFSPRPPTAASSGQQQQSPSAFARPPRAPHAVSKGEDSLQGSQSASHSHVGSPTAERGRGCTPLERSGRAPRDRTRSRSRERGRVADPLTDSLPIWKAGVGTVVHPMGAAVSRVHELTSDSLEHRRIEVGKLVTVEEVRGSRARISAPVVGWISVRTRDGETIVVEHEVGGRAEPNGH